MRCGGFSCDEGCVCAAQSCAAHRNRAWPGRQGGTAPSCAAQSCAAELHVQERAPCALQERGLTGAWAAVEKHKGHVIGVGT